MQLPKDWADMISYS